MVDLGNLTFETKSVSDREGGRCVGEAEVKEEVDSPEDDTLEDYDEDG